MRFQDGRSNSKIAPWLSLTPQEFDILSCVFRLQAGGVRASPQEVQSEYKMCLGKYLAKPNLFHILKILMNRGFLLRVGRGEYGVDFDGLEAFIDTRSGEIQREYREFESLSSDVREYFKKSGIVDSRPVVEYLDYDVFFRRVSNSIKSAEKYFSTGKFPNILYPIDILNGIGRDSFGSVLHDRFFGEKLEVNYITGLDLDNPYSHGLNIFGDVSKAYKVAENVIDRLEIYTERHDNLKVYYLEEPYGLDIIIPDSTKNEDCYMFIRDERMDILGGIYIKSPETKERAKKTFQNICASATLVRGKPGEKIIKKLRRKLKTEYKK